MMIDELGERVGAYLAQRDGRFRVEVSQHMPDQVELVVTHPFIPEHLELSWIEPHEDAPLDHALEWFIKALDCSDAVAVASESPHSRDEVAVLLRGIVKLAYEYHWHSTLRSQLAVLLRECGVLSEKEAAWLAERSHHLP